MSEDLPDYRGTVDNTKHYLRKAARAILERQNPNTTAHLKVGALYKLKGPLALLHQGFVVTGIGTNPISLLPAVHGVLLSIDDKDSGSVKEVPMMLDPGQIGESLGS